MQIYTTILVNKIKYQVTWQVPNIQINQNTTPQTAKHTNCHLHPIKE